MRHLQKAYLFRRGTHIRDQQRDVLAHGWLDNLFGGNEESGKADIEDSFEFVELPVPDSLFSGTALAGQTLARCYKASEHGWSARDFHDRCDLKGPSLVIARTKKGVVFGGFMPIEWKSANDYRDTDRDFLFYFPQGSSEPVRIQKRDSSPVYDYRRGGPQWGSEALIIGEPIGNVMGVFTGPDPVDTGIGDLRNAKSRLGLSHEKLPGGGTSLFGEGGRAELEEVEVFASPEIAKLY
eukprot:CAMPEP_0184489624 /NCGR_PEP_ID=MMETSP0113_2-20130426/15962_1 /TAXON_ID=91329 /ORGANISM="Norrisiella sphaerica, Strain BC52" /LENGTH=237 /DNA_ID=CAMNT_0026873157 /DNA_START=127 /DNA_END=840 /DNA_ORIENTATION=-